MRRNRFTETQLVTILKETEGSATAKEICGRHGISDATAMRQWLGQSSRRNVERLIGRSGHALIRGGYRIIDATPWRLYNPDEDPEDHRDVADGYPGLVAEFVAEW